jgi:hypothetical protein
MGGLHGDGMETFEGKEKGREKIATVGPNASVRVRRP